MRRKTFEEVLLEAIDDAFSTLGNSAMRSTYYHLEKRFKIPRDDIPRRLQVFKDGLARIFGPGSRFLEILIMKKLHERVGCSFEWHESKPFAFVDYIAAVKRNYLKEN